MLAIEKSTRRPLASDATTTVDAGLDGRLRAALGYRVEGPDGDAGVIAGIPFSGRPPRPLVLVVRDGDCMRFVSLRRVRDVLSAERRILLWPDGGGGRS
jgi:hypothetical protein